MKILLALLIAGALPARAHFPPGVTYQVFQFPDDQVPVMDGSAGDWAAVPSTYTLSLRDHEEVSRGLGDDYAPQDLDLRKVAVGWNDRLNRLYFMAEVYDDVHRFHKDQVDSLNTLYSRTAGAYVHGADIWEIVIDADHAGEQVVNFSKEDMALEMRQRSAFTQNYHLYLPPLNGYYWHWLWGRALWTESAAYSGVGWQYDGEDLSGGTVFYECYLTPFDDLHPAGPDSSRVHDLKENEVIGLSWAFLDADSSATEFDAFWSLSRKLEMYCMGQYLVDFRLMPVEEGLFGE
jgi:hypothetical protein